MPIAFPVRTVTVPRDTLPAPLFVTEIVPPVPPFAVPVPALPPLAAQFLVCDPVSRGHLDEVLTVPPEFGWPRSRRTHLR